MHFQQFRHKLASSRKKQIPHAEDFIPVKDIRNGIIETVDGRYLRIIEVEPINFLLRSTSEQRNIVASFASWMKISPVKVQIKVLTKKADIGKHLRTIERDMESENNPKCRELQLDYYRLIQTIGTREAITRRFLVIFEYEAVTNRKPEYAEIVSALETAVQTARQYFLHCDNAVVNHDDENAFLMEILYTIFNRSTCEAKTVDRRVRDLQAAQADPCTPIPLKSVLAPDSIDLTHGSYPDMDYSSSGSISGGTIELPYRPALTVADLMQKDGSIGTVSIKRIGLSAKVYEGASNASMAKGAGHYTGSGLYDGNIGLFGHNRGSHAYFGKLKNVKVGDTVTYKTNQGTKTYEVKTVMTIASDDYSFLNEMGDNRITMITCIANQPSLRLCVQAVEIR